MNGTNLLVIFAKYPEIGKVKTRLGKEIGYKNSMLVYKAMLKDIILNISKDRNYDLALCYTPEDRKEDFKNIFGVKILHSQTNGTLGKKLIDCFRHFLMKYINVVIIGSDVPLIDTYIVKNALKSLNDKDIVLGESDDGGYYLVGMKRVYNILNHTLYMLDPH